MKRNLIQSLIAGIVLVGLVAWYFVYEKKYRPENAASEEKAKQLTSLERESIQEIIIEKPGNIPALKLKKTGNDWHLTSPVEDKADTSSVTALLSGVVGAKSERTVEEKATDLERYGLKTPAVTVSLRKGEGAETKILVGSETPVGSSVYAMVGGSEKVYKVPSSLKSAADKDVKALRNKAIHEYPQSEIAEVEVSNSKGSFILKKVEDNKWLLAREDVPADTAEARKLVSTLTELRATDFASEDGKNLASFGLAKPAAKITLTSMVKDKPRLVLLVGKEKGKAYVQREGKTTVYEVEKDTPEKLDKAGMDLRSLELAHFSRFEVKKFKLEKGKDSLEFTKAGSEWSMPLDPNFKVDSNKVDALLTKLQDTKIAKYTTEKAATLGLDKPQFTLRVFEKKDTSESETVTLKFGRKVKAATGNLVATERKGLATPFYINEEDFRKLSLSKQDFAKVEVEAPKPAGKGPEEFKVGEPKLDKKSE